MSIRVFKRPREEEEEDCYIGELPPDVLLIIFGFVGLRTTTDHCFNPLRGVKRQWLLLQGHCVSADRTCEILETFNSPVEWWPYMFSIPYDWQYVYENEYEIYENELRILITTGCLTWFEEECIGFWRRVLFATTLHREAMTEWRQIESNS